MANMEYCRYENTLADLRDCYEDMGHLEGLNEYDEKYTSLSESEKKSLMRLIKLCVDIAIDYKDIHDPPLSVE